MQIQVDVNPVTTSLFSEFCHITAEVLKPISARKYAALANLRRLLNVCAKFSYIFLAEYKYLDPVHSA